MTSAYRIGNSQYHYPYCILYVYDLLFKHHLGRAIFIEKMKFLLQMTELKVCLRRHVGKITAWTREFTRTRQTI